MVVWYGFVITLAWKECYNDLNLFGKILFAPLLTVLAILTLPIGLVEFILIDSWVFLALACSKTCSVKDFFDFVS